MTWRSAVAGCSLCELGWDCSCWAKPLTLSQPPEPPLPLALGATAEDMFSDAGQEKGLKFWPVPYLFICNNPFSALDQTLFYPCTSLLANNKHQNIVFPLTAPYDAQWISLVCGTPPVHHHHWSTDQLSAAWLHPILITFVSNLNMWSFFQNALHFHTNFLRL